MSENGAREVILAYLSTFEIKPGMQTPSRNEIRDWCFVNQHRYDVKVKLVTYKKQMTKMTIGTDKNTKEGHSEGLDNVFASSSIGKRHLVVDKLPF